MTGAVSGFYVCTPPLWRRFCCGFYGQRRTAAARFACLRGRLVLRAAPRAHCVRCCAAMCAGIYAFSFLPCLSPSPRGFSYIAARGRRARRPLPYFRSISCFGSRGSFEPRFFLPRSVFPSCLFPFPPSRGKMFHGAKPSFNFFAFRQIYT